MITCVTRSSHLRKSFCTVPATLLCVKDAIAHCLFVERITMDVVPTSIHPRQMPDPAETAEDAD